jgi:major type 1 subunit fimbrin (pilin)
MKQNVCFLLRSWLIALVLLALFHPMNASAQSCAFTTGSAANLNATTPATISIPRDAAIGTVIYSTGKTLNPSTTFNITCPSGATTGVQNIAGPQPAAAVTFFPIGDTGISYQFLNINSSAQGAFPQNVVGSSWGSSPAISYTIQFIKTGPIASGTTLSAQPLGTYQFGNQTAFNLMLTTSMTISQPACTTSDVAVNMGMPSTSGFKGVGSRVAITPFAIKLNNCPSGINSVAYQIDATTSVINSAASVVALNMASSATGLGLQILDDTLKPVPLGTTIPVKAYSKAGGNFSILLNAAYYQTNSTVTSGRANSSMIFTMTYQ